MSISSRLALSSALVAAFGVWTVLPSANADAHLDEFAVNGTFTAISDGQWAKTNERFEREATVVSTWTITTSCTTAMECSGHMTSDQGWGAEVSYTAPLWYVTRTLADWMTCPDGSGTVPGQQMFKFFEDQFDRPNLRGWDNTLGPSGACGVNKVLNIELPFKLIPLD